MKILLASSEVFPYSKTGGLADMVGALGKALAQAGHEIGIVTPLYRGVRDKVTDLESATGPIHVALGGETVSGLVWKHQPSPGLTIYFVDQPAYFDRPALYGEAGADYPDNAARFIFLSKCVAHLARYLAWQPDVVHAHDWQVGLVPLLLKHQEMTTAWRNPPASVLTIHNLAYQGVFPAADFALANLPRDYFTPDGVEYYGHFNCLKAGIVYADMITTVSPRYAREITTEQLGCGLDGVLRSRLDRLVGILNGVDYSEWNTDQNPALPFPYSVEDLSGKTATKLALQRELGLPEAADIPLFASISRLAEQKGIDIELTALEEMLPARMQFVCLGSGDPDFEQGFLRLAGRFPDKVAARIGYNQALSHRIEAACDFFLMPSRFEPCGLNQMYSLRYGAIPIVRVTGGLDDSITDITEDLEAANGIKFYEYSARALTKAMRKALVLYSNPELLRHYRENAMAADFSWASTTGEYLEVFGRALAVAGRTY